MTPDYRNVKCCVLTLGLVTTILSCTTVKEYQKNKLNDAEMTLGHRSIQRTETSFQTYREASSGANGGKNGGGCGCN